ncbi:MAG: Ig-like domain-containing protein, partial [Bacteroidota bacterium]
QESSDCGDNYRIYTGLEPDTWYTIRQYIKLNTPGQRDGVVVMWIDNEETFRKEDALIRKAGKDNLKINALVMHTYRGGARTDPVWHSPRDEFAFFDDFKVWTGGLACIGINEKPVISFTSPANDTTLMVGDDIVVNVDASDVDGIVNNVKLYLNDTLVRIIDEAPFVWGDSLSNDSLLKNMQTGIYTLRATVEDDERSTNMKEITVVVGEVDTAPTVTISTPADGTVYNEGDDIVVNALASDVNGTISNVRLYLNGNFIRQENVAPYEWGHRPDIDPELKNMPPGTYTFKVVVEDNDGETNTDSITVSVMAVTSTASLDKPLVSIRPNIARNNINLHLPAQLLNGTYQIFDLTGKVVKTIQPQQPIEVLHIGDLPSGMYFIVFGEVSYRFVRM